MLSDRMQKALNGQLNAEIYSSYLYLSMNAYFKSANLDGFANWMYAQAQEELMHATKFYDFVHQRGGRVLLAAIDSPPTDWDSPLAVFEDTLQHEQKVTSFINELVEIAIDEHDHATQIFLQWFVTEQVEEEESVGRVLEQLKMLGDARQGLFMMDREMASRKASGVSVESE
jgi:ferritin